MFDDLLEKGSERVLNQDSSWLWLPRTQLQTSACILPFGEQKERRGKILCAPSNKGEYILYLLS